MNQRKKVQDGDDAAAASGAAPIVSEFACPEFTRAPADAPAELAEGVLWVPSEILHIARVSLPVAKASARLRALPYAFEPLLGEPLDNVHVALGPALAGSDFVASATSRRAMQAFADRSRKAAMLVPDVFLLPVPEAGLWNVGEADRRVLVRTPDGAGFATSPETFRGFHEAAGSPACCLLFGSGEGLPHMQRVPLGQWPRRADLLDLRQGAFAARDEAKGNVAILQSKIAAAIVATMTFMLGVEASFVQGLVARQHSNLSAGLAEKFPGLEVTKDAAQTIQRLSVSLEEAGETGFIGLFSSAANALEPGGSIAIRNAQFSASQASLVLLLEAGSVEGFNDYVRRLEGAGLAVSAGSVATIPGGATGEVSVSYPAGGL